MSVEQPELMNEWGTRFYGKAKTATGDFWWYEERLADGTIKRHPLLPVQSLASQPQGDGR